MTDFLGLPAVEAEIVALIAKFPGWEPGSLRLQPAMVPVAKLHEWHRALTAALASVEREAAFVRAARAALREIVNVLGPEPADCGCQGCAEEMQAALNVARGALALERER